MHRGFVGDIPAGVGILVEDNPVEDIPTAEDILVGGTVGSSWDHNNPVEEEDKLLEDTVE